MGDVRPLQRMFTALAVVGVALVTLVTSTAVAGALPTPPAPDASCVPSVAFLSLGSCVGADASTRTVRAGDEIALGAAGFGSYDFMNSLSCGDQACAYWGLGWKFPSGGQIAPIEGACPSLGGLESAGRTTREVPSGMGSCRARVTGSSAAVLYPGSWHAVNVVLGQSRFGTDMTTWLIGIEPELFPLTVTAQASGGPLPARVLAVRAGTSPDISACVADSWYSSWLPDRTVPDCVSLHPGGSGAQWTTYLPDGDWDVLAPYSGTGSARSAPSAYSTARATVTNGPSTASITRRTSPRLTVGLELLGGPSLAVNENRTARITMTLSDRGDSVPQATVTLNPPLLGSYGFGQPAGSVTIGSPSPTFPGAGLQMTVGQSATFDVPVRGFVAGNVRLSTALVTARTDVGDVVTASAGLDIAVQTASVPTTTAPPTGSVCGFDVLTTVASASAGSVLQLVSVPGVAAGDTLVVDPCTSDAEQVRVASLSGANVTVVSAMVRVHQAGAKVVRLPSGTTLSTAATAAGDTRIEILANPGVNVGDTIVIEPGTSREERAVVTGFGSFVVAPLTKAHPAYSRIDNLGSVPDVGVPLASGRPALVVVATLAVTVTLVLGRRRFVASRTHVGGRR